MDKIYLVKYDGGDYDDQYNTVIFATVKKTTAIKYVTRFNRILKKWKNIIANLQKINIIEWIKEEHMELHYKRWQSLHNITKCYYEEVSVR